MSRLLKGLAFTMLSVVTAFTASAQGSMPVCSGNGAGAVYFADAATGDIYKMNLANPAVSTPVGITLPQSPTAGLSAVSLAVASLTAWYGGLPTYYTTFYVGPSRYVHYWNGTNWVNTGHILNVDNICGGGGYLFGTDANGFVYRYNGTANSTFIGNVGVLGSRDIAADCAGNIYVIKQGATPAVMQKWIGINAALSAVPAQTYTLSGAGAGNEGFAINGNNVYYDGADGKLYTGIISGSTVSFTSTTTTPFNARPVSDFGSCGFAGSNFPVTRASLDTVVACQTPSTVQLRATGPGPYNWTVLSGPATISGTGQTVNVTATAPAVITYKDADCNGVNTITDTTVIFVTTVKFIITPDHTIYGCNGIFNDTLHAVKIDSTQGVSYAYQWTPITDVVGSSTDLDVIVQPKRTTRYILTTTTINGCSYQNSVLVRVVDSTPHADFQYLINLGCDQDTVRFFNTSTGGIDSIAWDFVDSAGNNGNWIYSTQVSPRHIFLDQGQYDVLLKVKNRYCLDTIRKLIDILHPLKAYFTVDDDSVCTGTIIKFINGSGTPPPPPGKAATTFAYNFGDGTTSILSSPTHKYDKAGTYIARLVLLNYLGCRDTFYRTLRVDSTPFVRIITADTAICQGQAVNLVANYLTVGNTGLTYDLGDGTVFQNMNSVSYAFAEPGTYNVVLTAHYRICPDITYKYSFKVRPFPGVNIGPDTVLCPNGSPIVLTDRVNIGNPAAKYLWNTGETTSAISARNIGTYWARVNIGGCTATDSVVINKDCYIDIPNSFTPNSDGTNDYFLPRQFMSRSVNTFKMTIFNRYGQIIFETTNLNGRGWDGRFNDHDQPQGVYVYMIDVGFDNGAKEHYTGNVTLLR